MQDCKSTLNQQWDGKQSLICQQQSVLAALKRKCFFFYWRCKTLAPQNRADPLMSSVVFFPPKYFDLDTAGHLCHLDLVLLLSGHPCEASGKMFRQNGGS